MTKIKPSEITPERTYISRRRFISRLGALGIGTAALQACAAPGRPSPAAPSGTSVPQTGGGSTATPSSARESALPTLSGHADELGDPLTNLDAITHFNDYYEFSTGKEAVAQLAKNFSVRPWTVEVGGLVNKPTTFDIDDLLAFDQEQRIYRLRCVEGWSMVIPWLGFPLAKLLQQVEPLSSAKFVRFETAYDPQQMPGQESLPYPWPYVEGLRIDEAMHHLTILSVGLYGKLLLPQNGAPIRLVIPWKYGFKSIKAIVKIDLVEERPVSLWEAIGADEYGFWANVNPQVPHPRWSQATESRIGESGRRETLLFNGYAEEVASLYPNLDDRSWYY